MRFFSICIIHLIFTSSVHAFEEVRFWNAPVYFTAPQGTRVDIIDYTSCNKDFVLLTENDSRLNVYAYLIYDTDLPYGEGIGGDFIEKQSIKKGWAIQKLGGKDILVEQYKKDRGSVTFFYVPLHRGYVKIMVQDSNNKDIRSKQKNIVGNLISTIREFPDIEKLRYSNACELVPLTDLKAIKPKVLGYTDASECYCKGVDKSEEKHFSISLGPWLPGTPVGHIQSNIDRDTYNKTIGELSKHEKVIIEKVDIGNEAVSTFIEDGKRMIYHDLTVIRQGHVSLLVRTQFTGNKESENYNKLVNLIKKAIERSGIK